MFHIAIISFEFEYDQPCSLLSDTAVIHRYTFFIHLYIFSLCGCLYFTHLTWSVAIFTHGISKLAGNKPLQFWLFQRWLRCFMCKKSRPSTTSFQTCNTSVDKDLQTQLMMTFVRFKMFITTFYNHKRCVLALRNGVRLAIDKSRVQIPAGLLSQSMGKLSLASLWDIAYSFRMSNCPACCGSQVAGNASATWPDSTARWFLPQAQQKLG